MISSSSSSSSSSSLVTTLHVDSSSSALVAALSRQTAAMTTSSSVCLLDLVEVISVDSSDEEDGSVAVPLQLVLKQEAADGIHVKYELREAAAGSESDVVDLCSNDDESDSGDGHVAAGAKATERVKTANDYVLHEQARQRRGGKELSINASLWTLRFKRRKVRHEGLLSTDSEALDTAAAASISEDSTASLSASSGSEFESDDGSATNGYEVDDEYADDSGEDDDRPTRAKTSLGFRRSQLHSSGLTRDQVDDIILCDVRRLEAKKPWRFVYRCLEVPFENNRTVDAFDLLFERWDAFWKVYGRAVWERYFWAPLQPGTLEYNRRKNRQWRAMRTFRALASDLREKLGSQFLKKVAGKVHNGWWYRTGPLVLRELFYLDKRKYAMYLQVHRERFPRGSRFEKSLDAAWCLDEEFTGGYDGGRGGCDGACLAWQDVTKSDDECGDGDEEDC